MKAVLATALAAMLVLAGASGARGGSFELWHGLNGPARRALDAECDRFNRSQTQDRIVCLGLGSYEITLQRTAAAFRAGRQPALVHVFDAATQEMIQSGATQSIPVAIGPEPASVSRFYADDHGTPYALPFNASTLLLYANHDLLARAGVSAPPETWEAFEATAARLKRSGVSCPFAFRLDPWWWLEQASAVAGVPIATQGNGLRGLDARFVFASGVHRRMMQDLLRWRREGYAVLFDNSALGSPQRAFVQGRCAMVLDTSGAAGGFSSLAKGRFKVDVGLVPRFTDLSRHSTAPGGGALWMLTGGNASTRRGVMGFLKFVQQPAEQARLAQATGYLPLSSAAQRLFAREPGVAPLQKEVVALATASLDQGSPALGLRLGAYVRFRAIWLEEMQRAFAGAESLDQALARSQQRGDALLRRFQATYAATLVARGPR